MSRRLELQYLLEDILGNTNVYYQPPGEFRMNYPAIRYSLTKIDKRPADNQGYILTKRYELILISKEPDNPVVTKLLELPMCSYDRQYIADNLYHDVFTLYY